MKARNILYLFYTSMIIYIIGGFFVGVYSLIIKPISEMYNEEINIMISPVFGNYAAFLSTLFYAALSLTIISLALFIMVLFLAHSAKRKFSNITLALTISLYIFAFVALVVTAP